MYHVELFFAEIDSRVNASGQRVFNITINGENFYPLLDVYERVGLYASEEIYSKYPLGPYTSGVSINATRTSTSAFPPFIAGAEILELLDDPMAPPTSPIDGT
jgi:hypothetical protein